MLGFAEYGAPRGKPVFYFHGWPGSRLEAALLDDAARDLGVRIIAADRPGYGLSTFLAGRKLVTWPRDMQLLANSLKIDRFSVLGVSGGGPYALACAALLPERVERAAVVCGVGPLTHADSTIGMQRARQFACALLRQSPAISRPLSYTMLRGLRTGPAKLIEAMARLLPEPDRITLSSPDTRAALTATFTEALIQGVRGAAHDLRVYFAPWGFEASGIGIGVRFWHGEFDDIVPPHMSRRLAALVPGAQIELFPREGHYSLPIARRAEILQSLVAA
jgi:pimeloyl-ACP methyl ester carboxylesterase